MSASVSESVDVIVEADGSAGVIGVFTTACTAAAALDPQYIVEDVSTGAVEAELHGARERRGAAAAVSASPTGTRAISLSCRASTKGDADWLMWAEGSLTFLPLQDDRDRATVK